MDSGSRETVDRVDGPTATARSERDETEGQGREMTGASEDRPTSDPLDLSVLVVGPFGRGGINDYIEEQLDRLAGRVDVDAHDSGAPPLGSGRPRAVWGLVTGALAFVRFLFRRPPDVVHVHTSHRFSFYRKTPYVLFAAGIWDVPVVLHVHGSSFDEFVASDSLVATACQRRVFRASDEIIVLSGYWRDVIATRTDASKIRVLPNAVDPETFPPDPADPADGTPHVVFVSNLISRKGVDELADAVERLAERRPGEFRVSIAGDGPRADRIESLSESHDEVTYLGYVSERRKRELLRDGSIYVLPTHAEGLPIAMLEGMAGANAVVSTSVGSIPEVIGPDRGRLVEPGDVDELVAALEELVTHPERRARLAENNRRAIETDHSWNRVTEELLDVYRRLA